MKYSTFTNSLSLGLVINLHAWLSKHVDLLPESSLAPEGKSDGKSDGKRGGKTDAEWMLMVASEAEPSVLIDWWQPALSAANIVAIILGVVLGTTVTSVALTYTGAYPVNLLLLLAIFVLVPGITLIGSVLSRVIFRKEQVGVTSIMARLLTRVNEAGAEHLALHSWRYQDVLYWHGQGVLQRFSIAYLATALAVFLSLLAFTDLAFGWSSTLQLDTGTVLELTEFLSLPWQAWLPVAVPSIELVEASRFFRMAPDNDPILLGQWWPFIAMCILVWALLPRLLMALIVRLSTRRAISRSLFRHPEVTAFLRHRDASTVSYSSHRGGREGFEDADLVKTSTDADVDVNILWNGADPETLEKAIAFNMGGSTAELFSLLPNEMNRARIFVKGWEPPLLEFLDFVQALRGRVGEGVEIVVSTTSLPDHPLHESDRKAWRATLARLHDERVYLEVST